MDEKALEEHRILRQEITERIGVLHGQLNIAAVLLFILVVIIWVFGVNGGTTLNWLLLESFIPFICLAFNYQANQMTMEAVARYIDEQLVPKMDGGFGWGKFWSDYKARVRLISFTKVLALILPIVSIFVWSILAWGDLTQPQKIVAVFNALLFFIGVVNFRYKYSRV